MALKKSGINTSSSISTGNPGNSKRAVDDQRRKVRTLAKQQQASERIAGATVTLTGGIADALSASTQLNTTVEEISAMAEESAGAAQEFMSAIIAIRKQIDVQLDSANMNAEQSISLQKSVHEIEQDIIRLVDGVSVSSELQVSSFNKMNELEKQADNINDAVKQVMRIADQTNLLALNAAIEAGRAGKHGKGFAVVADTVRTLAEISESNARNISELITDIQKKARQVGGDVKSASETAISESDKAKAISKQLITTKSDMDIVYKDAQAISSGAKEMHTAVVEAQQGAESVSAAADELSAAAEEILSTVDLQGQALNESEQAAQALEIQAEELKNSTDISKSSEEVAAAAEELSTSVSEINGAASEIGVAIQELNRGVEQATASAVQASTGMLQIEGIVHSAVTQSNESLKSGIATLERISDNKTKTEMMNSVLSDAAIQGKEVLKDIREIEQISRHIDKITDAIATVAIKTGMLAVNGAIEAARAGEFGKGFAVVSSDIQNLADDAAENIEQIRDLVKAIQDQAHTVMMDLSEVSVSSNADVENAKVTTKNLTTIETNMGELLEQNKVVLTSSEEIATAVIQAKKAIEQISTASEEAASSTKQSSIAADEQAAGTKKLSEAIEDIASIADELQSS